MVKPNPNRKEPKMHPSTETVSKPRGRQPGQRVQSLDFRAYKALRDFDFGAYFELSDNGELPSDAKDELIEALIARLREKDIF